MNEYGKRLNALAEWMDVEYQKQNRHPLSYTKDDLALIAPWFIHDDAEEYLKENFLIALKNGDLKNEPHPVATFMLLVHNLFAAKPKLPDPKCHARAHIHRSFEIMLLMFSFLDEQFVAEFKFPWLSKSASREDSWEPRRILESLVLRHYPNAVVFKNAKVV